jgi:tRNA A37 N6-isopentenylltransferase MiaA
MRNIESFMVEESKFVFPDINIPEGNVGVFWNHPDFKKNIDIRTKRMIDNGLINEINNIKNPSKTILQAIGLNLSEDIEENINIKTRRLAKKQITWFKKEERLKMINTSKEDVAYQSIMEIIDG